MSKVITKEDILEKAKILMERKQELEKRRKSYKLLINGKEKAEKEEAEKILEQI